MSKTKAETISYQKKKDDEKHVVPSFSTAEIIPQSQCCLIGIDARGCEFAWTVQFQSPDQRRQKAGGIALRSACPNAWSIRPVKRTAYAIV
jgi:hypothetical protein